VPALRHRPGRRRLRRPLVSALGRHRRRSRPGVRVRRARSRGDARGRRRGERGRRPVLHLDHARARRAARLLPRLLRDPPRHRRPPRRRPRAVAQRFQRPGRAQGPRHPPRPLRRGRRYLLRPRTPLERQDLFDQIRLRPGRRGGDSRPSVHHQGSVQLLRVQDPFGPDLERADRGRLDPVHREPDRGTRQQLHPRPAADRHPRARRSRRRRRRGESGVDLLRVPARAQRDAPHLPGGHDDAGGAGGRRARRGGRRRAGAQIRDQAGARAGAARRRLAPAAPVRQAELRPRPAERQRPRGADQPRAVARSRERGPAASADRLSRRDARRRALRPCRPRPRRAGRARGRRPSCPAAPRRRSRPGPPSPACGRGSRR